MKSYQDLKPIYRSELRVFFGKRYYQIKIRIEDDYLVGEIRTDIKPYESYRVYEKDHRITHEYWGGYVRHNLINREIYDLNSNLVNEEFICENHALMMYEPLIGTKV